jgi:hypothetical protein
LPKNKGESSSCKNNGWGDLIQGEFFFGRKILEDKLPGGKSLGKRWGQTLSKFQLIQLIQTIFIFIFSIDCQIELKCCEVS